MDTIAVNRNVNIPNAIRTNAMKVNHKAIIIIIIWNGQQHPGIIAKAPEAAVQIKIIPCPIPQATNVRKNAG